MSKSGLFRLTVCVIPGAAGYSPYDLTFHIAAADLQDAVSNVKNVLDFRQRGHKSFKILSAEEIGEVVVL